MQPAVAVAAAQRSPRCSSGSATTRSATASTRSPPTGRVSANRVLYRVARALERRLCAGWVHHWSKLNALPVRSAACRWTCCLIRSVGDGRTSAPPLWLPRRLASTACGCMTTSPVRRTVPPTCLECWTVLSALAAAVPQLAIGSLVLNVANRDAGTLAVMAATLQEISGGRLLLGIGAGGAAGTPYAAEQAALGRPVHGDVARRAAVESTIGTLRQVWSGTAGGAAGFLRPSPPPPVIVGGFGPKMAELAGRLGDGINAPPGPNLKRLLDVARKARVAAGRDPDTFLVTTSGSPTDDRLARLGVHRVITIVRPPYTDAVGYLARSISQR